MSKRPAKKAKPLSKPAKMRREAIKKALDRATGKLSLPQKRAMLFTATDRVTHDNEKFEEYRSLLRACETLLLAGYHTEAVHVLACMLHITPDEIMKSARARK